MENKVRAKTKIASIARSLSGEANGYGASAGPPGYGARPMQVVRCGSHWELFAVFMVDNRAKTFGKRLHSRHPTEQLAEKAAREEMGIAEFCPWFDDHE
jgi:hypothetical protein